MRLANYAERATAVLGNPGAERTVDIFTASDGQFGPDMAAIYEVWNEFLPRFKTLSTADTDGPLDRRKLGPPSPSPRQVFAVGLNYGAHAAESGFASPTDLPPVFTKYVSSFSGPDTTVAIPGDGNVDWEVELVAIIGKPVSRIDEAAAWSHVAGLTVGQDISERISQLRGPAAQFGLGKSFPGFSPQGPWLVTLDEFADADDLELGCTLDGEEVQKGRTRELIFSVPKLIATLSHNVTLYPGDVLFTGTPAGVGVGRQPPRFIQPGQRLDSWIEGIGELHQVFEATPNTP